MHLVSVWCLNDDLLMHKIDDKVDAMKQGQDNDYEIVDDKLDRDE